MKKKITYFLFIFLLFLGILFVYRSCTKIKFKELEILYHDLKSSDKNIKEIKFYFQRPDYCADIIYNGTISNDKLRNIVTHFNQAIDDNLAKKISSTYWNNKPIGFYIFIFQGHKLRDIPALYQIYLGSSKESHNNENSTKASTIKQDTFWRGVTQNYIDPKLYNKRLKEYNSYINKLRILIGGTILVPLLCFLFFQYQKRKKY